MNYNTTSSGDIFLEIEAFYAVITIYHPASNSMPFYLLKRLADTITDLEQNKAIKLILLKSKGDRAFCAGASFDELLTIETPKQGSEFFSGFAKVILSIKQSTKLVIARVQGKAVGGGVGLIAACDYVFATESASIKLSELAIGIGPFVIEPALRRKIGLQATTHLTFNPTEWESSQWAKDKGLFNQVFSNQINMDQAIQTFIENYKTYSIEAIKLIKKVTWSQTEHWEQLLMERASISGQLVLSHQTKAILNRFKNNNK